MVRRPSPPAVATHAILLLLCLSGGCTSGGGGGGTTSTTGGPPSTGTSTGTGGTPQASGTPPAIVLTKVASGFTNPTAITNAGDGSNRLFILEKRGVVRVIRDGTVASTPFLDISSRVMSAGEEQGLLGIAFPPGFATKGHFYVDYTNRNGVGDTVIERITVPVNSDTANSSGSSIVLSVPQPFANHNGGQLAFGPDGFLYVGMGDGGGAGDPQGNAQNRTRLLGKILRLDVESPTTSTYAIPAGNPFGSEVWSLGLRNPWRFSFDRANGDLYVADVGQDLFEEINIQPSGRSADNYGWNTTEGMHCFRSTDCNQTGLTMPVVEYGHDGGNCSVTGGFVYRGSQIPSLQGTYVYGDFCSGRIWGLKRSGSTWQNTLLLESHILLSSFGEDEAGNIYAADFATGDIYRIDLKP